MGKTNSIGEEAIDPQTQQQVAGDITPQALQQKMAQTMTEKGKLDYILKGIASKVGVDFESRTKSPDTVVKKIAQKRIQGRDYNLENVNDLYGGRFIIKSPKDAQTIKSLLQKAENLGLFKIDKQENVKTGTYSANHTDFETPNGVKGEVQIQTPQENLESVSNHSLRAVYGENPPEGVAALRDKQAQIASKTSHNEALEKASQIQKIAKQNQGKPLDPRIIASILKQ